MSTEIVAVQQPKLLEIMAQEYGMEATSFKNVLLKTVFPQQDQNRPAPTMEQLGMFCMVAHKYKLNPLIREIFAFPAKGGGITPIVSIDGWISLVQRQANYNGHKFVYEWADGRVGGKLLAATCFIYRKDLQNPIEHTEFMEECVRGTDVWQKWPRRMLTHKTFIQCARYAFGFSGIYDEDEGERILEGTMKPAAAPEIQMPQRLKQVEGPKADQPELAKVIEMQPAEAPVEDKSEGVREEPDPVQTLDSLQGLFDSGLVQKGTESIDAIGRGRAQRLYAILGKHKIHTEEETKVRYQVQHLADMPVSVYEQAVAWAEGKLEDKG